MSILVFGAIYLFGMYAFYRHAADTAPHCDEDERPVVIQFRRRRPANTN